MRRVTSHPGFDKLAHKGPHHPGFDAIAIKPSHRGELHRDLAIPEGEPIPEAKLKAAEHSPDPKVRKRARFADNMRKTKR